MNRQTESDIALEVQSLREHGVAAATEYFERDRHRLLRFVKHRTDERLLGRLDSEDVLQEAFLVVQRRYADFVEKPSVPFYVWLRAITGQVLVDLHRKHLNLQRRNVDREVSLHKRLPFQSTSAALGDLLAGSITSPSNAAIRAEEFEGLKRCLAEMSELDREVLVLRHMEQMTNGEVAHVLQIDKSAATKRYVRALKRLRQTIEGADQ